MCFVSLPAAPLRNPESGNPPSSAPAEMSIGVGIVPSTQNAPVTRVILLSVSGLSTSTSSSGGSLLAMDFERDVRHDAAHFFALVVLLALYNEIRPPGRARCHSIRTKGKWR